MRFGTTENSLTVILNSNRSFVQDQAKSGTSTAQSGYSGGAFYTTVSLQKSNILPVTSRRLSQRMIMEIYSLVLMQQSHPAPPNTRLSPLPPEPADFYNDFATPVDKHVDTNKVLLRFVLFLLSFPAQVLCYR
jgi:hypothetical protein